MGKIFTDVSFFSCLQFPEQQTKEIINAEIDLNQLRMQSAIYSLDPGDKLKDYHKAINDACFEITKENPSLVHDKKNLQKLA